MELLPRPRLDALIVMDSRTGRVLEEGRRSIFDEGEWDWVQDKARGGFDHLLIGTSDPYLLAPGLHYLEAWNEAVCNGAWGEGPAKIGEDQARTRLRSLGRFPALVYATHRPAGGDRLRERGRPRPRSASSPVTSTTRTSPRLRSGATRT